MPTKNKPQWTYVPGLIRPELSPDGDSVHPSQYTDLHMPSRESMRLHLKRQRELEALQNKTKRARQTRETFSGMLSSTYSFVPNGNAVSQVTSFKQRGNDYERTR